MKAKEALAEKDLIIDALKHEKFSFSQTTTKTKENRIYLEIKRERLQIIIDKLEKEADAYYYQNISQIEISGKELSFAN